MDIAQQRQWWKEQGDPELRGQLMEHWDPIGIKDVPEAASEYDGYRGQVVELLRQRASAEDVAAHLAELQTSRMGLPASPEHLLPVGQLLVAWYEDSVSRWEASHSSG